MVQICQSDPLISGISDILELLNNLCQAFVMGIELEHFSIRGVCCKLCPSFKKINLHRPWLISFPLFLFTEK